MTGWLSEWLRNIILIILLAAFVDLLIPNNAHQRYVKVVISLIILLTILVPVIAFLNQEPAIQQALEKAVSSNDKSHALNLILSNGAKLRSVNDRHSAQLVEQQVADMMKEQLEKALSLDVKEITARITEVEGKGPTIAYVQVILGMKSSVHSGADEETDLTDRQVKVEPVNSIHVKVNDTPTEHKDQDEPIEKNARSEFQLKSEREVIQLLASQWGLEKISIQVEWG